MSNQHPEYIEVLLAKIEIMREKLNSMVVEREISRNDLLKISQDMDKLLNEYHSIMY